MHWRGLGNEMMIKTQEDCGVGPPPVLSVLERMRGFLEIRKCRGGFVSTTWKVSHSPELLIVLGFLSLSPLSWLLHTVPPEPQRVLELKSFSRGDLEKSAAVEVKQGALHWRYLVVPGLRPPQLSVLQELRTRS